MSDIRFNCPSCRQSLEAPPDMVGQVIDCPSCTKPIEIPTRPTPRVETPPPPTHSPPTPRPSQPPPTTRSAQPPSTATANVLPKILGVLVLIAIMVGGFFAYNFWKDQERRKAEAPFYVAAKEAIDQAHRMQSAVNVGLNYQKYGDEVIALATKIDDLLRAAAETGVENLNPDAKLFCTHIIEASESYRSALERWGYKIKDQYSFTGDSNSKMMQADWLKASDETIEADRVYMRLQK